MNEDLDFNYYDESETAWEDYQLETEEKEND